MDNVRFLLTKGADIHARDNFGLTPIDEAKKGNYPEIQTLLEKVRTLNPSVRGAEAKSAGNSNLNGQDDEQEFIVNGLRSVRVVVNGVEG